MEMPDLVTIAQRSVLIPDPQDCTDNADSLALLEALFDALVRRRPDGQFQPALAAHWQVSEDARCWRFSLREGLTFHDGTAIDANVMGASIARMQRPDVGATLGAPAVWGQYLGGAQITAIDALTLEIKTQNPSADLLDILVSGYALPTDRVDQPGFLDAPIGSGAYRFVRRRGDGALIMERNPDWWGGKVANRYLAWVAIGDRSDREQALRSGRVSVASKLSPLPDYGAAVTCQRHIDPTGILLLLNAARGPFTDPRVRRAVNLAVDRPALIDQVLQGAGQPLNGFVSPVHMGAVITDDGGQFDRSAAQRLLHAAGFAKGLTLHIDCPTRLPDEAEALTNALGAQLSQVGITLQRHVIADRTAYAEAVRDKQIHDLCIFDSSPMSTFRVLYEKIDSRQRGSWWQGYQNSVVEARLDVAKSTLDRTARAALYQASYLDLQADPPWLTLYNHQLATAVYGVHAGWQMRADGVLDVSLLPKISASLDR